MVAAVAYVNYYRTNMGLADTTNNVEIALSTRSSAGTRRLTWWLIAALVSLTAIACSSTSSEVSEKNSVIVPDDITAMDAREVERRLGGLLNESESGQAAQVIEPLDDEAAIDEILGLLDQPTGTSASEIVISVSPKTLASLLAPRLTIKVQPEHGTASVISSNQILYVPDRAGSGTDAFEYELFDGEVSVISQVMEIRS